MRLQPQSPTKIPPAGFNSIYGFLVSVSFGVGVGVGGITFAGKGARD